MHQNASASKKGLKDSLSKMLSKMLSKLRSVYSSLWSLVCHSPTRQWIQWQCYLRVYDIWISFSHKEIVVSDDGYDRIIVDIRMPRAPTLPQPSQAKMSTNHSHSIVSQPPLSLILTTYEWWYYALAADDIWRDCTKMRNY